jgi:hypothetical protein
MGVIFIPKPLLEIELEKGLDMSSQAEKMAEIARANAPVDTGEYRDSIHVETDGEGSRVVAGTDHGVWVEIGTEDTPAFHVLTQAAESAGFHLEGH